MSTYAIGDIQGCYSELQQLLKLIKFNPNKDILWSCGDLVNRGPNSLEVLRFFKNLKDRAIVVLGNHDLHLLALAYGNTTHLKTQDTLNPILEAPDANELIEWLRHSPFLHHDATMNLTMIHAGLPPQWNLLQARKYASELEETLRGQKCEEYLNNLYGNKPKMWSKTLSGWDRMRFITNCFTRLRYCSAEGKLAMKNKWRPSFDGNSKEKPWFSWSHRVNSDMTIIFGHWATLGFYQEKGIYALDSACVWGGALTALRLEDKKIFSLPCIGQCNPNDY
jgi:bis(5'-nucleosyl)-tetraphosphatase (symmetrical)